MSTDEVLNQIDGALNDLSVSNDAMRCNAAPIKPRPGLGMSITIDGVDLTGVVEVPPGGYGPPRVGYTADGQAHFADAPVVTHYAIYDQQVGGNLLAYGTLPDAPRKRTWATRITDRCTRILEGLWLWHLNHRRNR